jgi:hypothetical protein
MSGAPVGGACFVITAGYCPWVLQWRRYQTAFVAAVAPMVSQGIMPGVVDALINDEGIPNGDGDGGIIEALGGGRQARLAQGI